MSVGTQLKEARMQRKLSYTAISEVTKIQPWVLEALETDRLQNMMSPIYVKGFLASYARFLRLDPEPFLAQIQWPQAESTQPQEQLPPAQPAAPIKIQMPQVKLPQLQLPKFQLPKLQLPKFQLPRMRLPQWQVQLPKISVPQFTMSRLPHLNVSLPLLRRVGATVAFVAFAGGIVALNPLRWVSQRSLSATRLTANSPAEIAQEGRITVVRGPEYKEAKLSSTDEAVEKTVAPALASITPISEPLKPAKPPVLEPIALQPLELQINARRTAWIKVRADGKLLTQQRLRRGANERWVAKKEFEVVVSKPSQVELALNGQPITPFAIAHGGRVLITRQGVKPLPEKE